MTPAGSTKGLHRRGLLSKNLPAHPVTGFSSPFASRGLAIGLHAGKRDRPDMYRPHALSSRRRVGRSGLATILPSAIFHEIQIDRIKRGRGETPSAANSDMIIPMSVHTELLRFWKRLQRDSRWADGGLGVGAGRGEAWRRRGPVLTGKKKSRRANPTAPGQWRLAGVAKRAPASAAS